MSTGPIGLIGGLAGIPGGLKGATTEGAQHAQAQQQTRTATDAAAEKSAGIGQLSEEQHASERDGDGRRPWEENARHSQQPEHPSDAETAATSSEVDSGGLPDPQQVLGNRLDLTG